MYRKDKKIQWAGFNAGESVEETRTFILSANILLFNNLDHNTNVDEKIEDKNSSKSFYEVENHKSKIKKETFDSFKELIYISPIIS